jgi:hypothetical protein
MLAVIWHSGAVWLHLLREVPVMLNFSLKPYPYAADYLRKFPFVRDQYTKEYQVQQLDRILEKRFNEVTSSRRGGAESCTR